MDCATSHRLKWGPIPPMRSVGSHSTSGSIWSIYWPHIFQRYLLESHTTLHAYHLWHVFVIKRWSNICFALTFCIHNINNVCVRVLQSAENKMSSLPSFIYSNRCLLILTDSSICNEKKKKCFPINYFFNHIVTRYMTNSVAYGSQRLNAVFTRALQ